MSRSMENKTTQMVSLNVLYGLNGNDCDVFTFTNTTTVNINGFSRAV